MQISHIIWYKYLILIITAIVILLVGGILFFVFKEDDTEIDAIKFAKEYTLVGEELKNPF